MVSGSISLPSPGFFSPFPHGTRSLSVAVEYSALDRGRPGFGQGFSCPALLRYRIMEARSFRLRGCHTLWPDFPVRSAMNRLSYSTGHPHAALQPRSRRFGLLPVRSPLLGESLLISFPGLLRWFTSSGVAPVPYFIQAFRVAGSLPPGYPIRLSAPLTDMCSSTQLFAAYHGLPRLTAPRHPPWTYIRLTILSFPFTSLTRIPHAFQSSRMLLLATVKVPSSLFPSLVISNIRAPAFLMPCGAI